jgi:hypothetical protein
MLRISFDGSDKRLEAALRTKAPTIIEALRLKLDVQMLMLQSHVQFDKLSGQVLQHRSGKLINSIREIRPTVDGTTITGAVEGGGGPAFYGKFHEYGTDRTYEIFAKTKKSLTFMLNGKQVFVKKVLHPPIKERSFMRVSLEEMAPEIRASLQAALGEALNAE